MKIIFKLLPSENMLKYVITFILLIPVTVESQNSDNEVQRFDVGDGITYAYKKPKLIEILKYVPLDVFEFGKFTIQKENLPWVGLTVASTIALIPFDQKLLDNAIELGEPIGWDKDVRYDRLFNTIELLPQDINGAVYFLGNGVTTLLVGGAFYTFGKINNDFRSLNTANEVFEILISTGLTTQILKRVTGRQSPSAAIDSGNSGGHWTLFPSINSYQSNTPNYDAFPSGHIATMMATITVIATNYPEVKWIKPLGYSLMGILSFEMMSSKAHWVSDYPLAILIGYVIGKQAANRRIVKEVKRDLTGKIIESKFKTDFRFIRTSQYNMVGLSITF